MLKGMGDMGEMMKKAMSMQKEMKKVQKDLKKKIVETEVGGGMLTVKVNGQLEVLDVSIDREKADLNDVAMLEDLIVSGVNKGLSDAKAAAKEELGKATGGLNLPGMDGLV